MCSKTELVTRSVHTFFTSEISIKCHSCSLALSLKVVSTADTLNAYVNFSPHNKTIKGEIFSLFFKMTNPRLREVNDLSKRVQRSNLKSGRSRFKSHVCSCMHETWKTTKLL